jgi:hypothetical protein
MLVAEEVVQLTSRIHQADSIAAGHELYRMRAA